MAEVSSVPARGVVLTPRGILMRDDLLSRQDH